MSRGPALLPVLLTSDQARDDELAHRPLFEGAPEDAPVVGLAEDGEPLSVDRLDELGADIDEAVDDALEELTASGDAEWAEQDVPVKGGGTLKILVREGDGAESEDLLVPDVLLEAAESLDAKALAVAVPVRGVLLATDADQKWQLVAAFATAARMQHAAGEDDALWPGVLRVEDGHVTGVIALRTASLDAASRRGS